MPKLILIRGVSGSGKSTLAKKLIEKSGTHIETDMFFSTSGAYQFNAKLLPKAHSWCKLTTEQAMRWGDPLIVVSNTFTRLWEIEPYLDLAKKYNYETEILVTPRPWDSKILAERNVHKVPLQTILQQIGRFEF